MRRSGIFVMSTLGVGDVLLAQPLLQALREATSERIVVLARAGSPAQLTQRLGIADHVVSYVARWPHRLWGGAGLAPWIASQRFDRVMTTTGLNPYYSGLMALATGASVRIGERRGRLPWIWTDAVEVAPGAHMVVRNQALGIAAGVKAGLLPRFAPDERELAQSGVLVGDHRMVIALAPGSNRTIAHKRWPIGRFAELVTQLSQRGAHVVVLGGLDERDVGRQLAAQAGQSGLTNLVDATDVGTAAAVLARCRLAVGNDGMLLHLAAAVGIPTVAIFGPSDPALFAPRGPLSFVVRKNLPCSPCDDLHPGGCATRPCLEGIEISEVMDAIDGALAHRECSESRQ